MVRLIDAGDVTWVVDLPEALVGQVAIVVPADHPLSWLFATDAMVDVARAARIFAIATSRIWSEDGLADFPV
jgi:hypothetical protein